MTTLTGQSLCRNPHKTFPKLNTLKLWCQRSHLHLDLDDNAIAIYKAADQISFQVPIARP